MSQVADALQVQGQVALVTGGSAGIGREVAMALADAGAAVCVMARDRSRLDAVVDEITRAGGQACAYAGSATDATARAACVETCIAEFGRLDILVNNVGGGHPVTMMDLELDTLQSLLSVNLETALAFSQLAWRSWMRQHGGTIVNVTSLAGLRPKPGAGAYGVAKAAVGFLTRVLALELAPSVRVNAVAPGLIMTELALTTTTAAYREEAIRTRPLRRIGQPLDVAGAILMLASPAGAYITGQEIAIEGGALLL